MEFFSDATMRGLLASSLETAALGQDGFYDVGEGPGSTEGEYIDWLTVSGRERSVVEDVGRIRPPPAGSRSDPDLRLSVRRALGSPRRGPRGHS